MNSIHEELRVQRRAICWLVIAMAVVIGGIAAAMFISGHSPLVALLFLAVTGRSIANIKQELEIYEATVLLEEVDA